MSESPHSHSDQSKARISSSLRKIWEERLRQRRLQEKCYLAWARSIAEAAKEGSCGQEKLEWDSYEREKSDINSKHLQRKADKARAKEIAKLRAEKAAQIRAENAARRAQLRKEKEEKAKIREMELKTLARKKSEEMKMKMALSKGLKLKAKLTKVHHHRRNLGSSASIQREIEIEPQPIADNLDIDLIKIKIMKQRISLAEQIQAVKNRKEEFSSNNFLASSYPISSSEVEARDF